MEHGIEHDPSAKLLPYKVWWGGWIIRFCASKAEGNSHCASVMKRGEKRRTG